MAAGSTVVVSRSALADLIEDVEAIARLMQNMVYCRLMKKVDAVKVALIGEVAVEPTRCLRCGGPYGDHWAAPSPLWNYVMRGDDINGLWQYGELVCPQCFIAIAEERFGHPLSWRLYAEGVDEQLTTVTPSGRIWNPETWLWDDQKESE